MSGRWPSKLTSPMDRRPGRRSGSKASPSAGFRKPAKGSALVSEEVKKGMRAFKEAMDRIRSGESELEEVELPSGTVRLSKDGDAPNGFRIEPLGQETPTREKPATNPEIRERLHRFKEIAARLRSGDSDSEELSLPSGDTVRFTRDPVTEGGMTVESGDGKLSMRLQPFGPSPTRPLTYPEDIPFVPDCAVSIVEMPKGPARNVTWLAPPDPDQALDLIKHQLVEDGWEGSEPTSITTPMGVTISLGYSKDGRARMLSLSRYPGHAQIVLMELPGRKE